MFRIGGLGLKSQDLVGDERSSVFASEVQSVVEVELVLHCSGQGGNGPAAGLCDDPSKPGTQAV